MAQALSAFEIALAASAQHIEVVLNQLFPVEPENRLRQAMRYAMLSQGKRLRPFLVLQSAALFSVPVASALRVGAALECVHCYSLVHDDLPAMDNDNLRRGLPTTHRQFDEATAILAGDALLTSAFEILADRATHEQAEIRCQLTLSLAKAAGEAGMVGGQMLDIAAETQNFAKAQDIATMQALKTGALFRFACEAGAVLAQQDPKHLRQYADDIGLAFQIADDILDVEADAMTLGKATQKDKARGKATFVHFYGLDGAKNKAQELCASAIAALAPYGEKAELLCDTARFIISRKK